MCSLQLIFKQSFLFSGNFYVSSLIGNMLMTSAMITDFLWIVIPLWAKQSERENRRFPPCLYAFFNHLLYPDSFEFDLQFLDPLLVHSETFESLKGVNSYLSMSQCGSRMGSECELNPPRVYMNRLILLKKKMVMWFSSFIIWDVSFWTLLLLMALSSGIENIKR